MMWVMTRHRGRTAATALAVAACAALAVGAALLVPGAKKGDVDPVGMLISGAGLVAGIVSAWLAWLTLRDGDSNPAATAARLAGQVLPAETQARRRLLAGDAAAIDVRFVLRPAAGPSAAGARPEGTLRGVADYYRQLRPGRMVITGAAGSGKTVLAIELVLALLDTRAPDDPVPVRLSLASWAELTTTARLSTADPPPPDPHQVRAWLVRVLVETYHLRRAAARSLVDAGMVLPVLDGLDEMDAVDHGTHLYRSRARHALDTLNAYQQGRDRAPLVLTVRSTAYLNLQQLNVWARDAARVEIAAVSLLQSREFITRRASNPDRWTSVLEHLSAFPSGALARGLSTPWRLTVAVAAHEQRAPASGAYLNTPRDLLNPALGTEDAVRDHLIGLLLTTTLQAHPTAGHAAPEQVRAWLGTLATYLNTNAATGRTVAGRTLSGTDLVPHELWPVAGPRRARATHTLLWVAVVCVTYTPGVPAAASASLGVGALVGLLRSWRGWPEPLRLGWGSAPGRRKPIDRFVFWLVVGTLFGSVFGLALVLVLRRTGRLDSAPSVAVGPKGVVRGDAVFGIAIGIAGGLTVGIMGGVASAFAGEGGFLGGFASGLGVEKGRFIDGFAKVFVSGIAGSLAIGLGIAAVAVRYLVLLMWTRRGSAVLPLSLGHFLAWAEEAGLLRIAGNAYQFRHRELQDWLADPANQV